ncbi:MAG: hypothetical protein NWQ54_14640 [Paraglaciecola sp.]|uniref:hypothetical protein n=1 Tax=Pseudomonadati TaxID=3379134 RepID=UPI00273E3A73|nr:hypothetical protein [Paraglaciecola sp.]MDP5031152.1 hypothetical protein [Paraglaciecola sp.]MDP5132119.1 hypothetical protein [Paraglaciecola sp.]
MSCLTRNLQNQLCRYLQKNSAEFFNQDPEGVRVALVSKGVCPSDVTTDQVRLILKQAESR